MTRDQGIRRPRTTVVAAVSIYLLAVGVWLVLSRQVRAPSFLRIALLTLRPRYAADVSTIDADAGRCYVAPLPRWLLTDLESSSSLQLYEDDRPLGPAHAMHDDIRRLGEGRYSHWGSRLYFSASDNSDPRTNGCRYAVREVPRGTDL